MNRTLRLHEAGALTIDQTRLPFEEVTLDLRTHEHCVQAIRSMQVRGAPLIGAVGALGLALALRTDAGDDALESAFSQLLATRPTAVNLQWALSRVRDRVAGLAVAARAAAAWSEVSALCEEDVACNRAIGEHGVALLAPERERARAAGRSLQVLTHCNAGALATIAFGTALAPLYQLHAQGEALHVWVDETRPRNQGASLTAWELARAGIAHTVIADNAGGLLMMQGRVDAVIVGCDRVAANGDVANKIGTYLKALAARAHGIPFLVACPGSTIDAATPDGAAIVIEERSASEVSHLRGRDPHGNVIDVRLVPDGTNTANPAFDITPAALVTALVTERGPCTPVLDVIRATFPEKFASQEPTR